MTPEQVTGLEEDLRRAQLASDVDALDALLDDGLFFTDLSGEVVSKADDLAAHRAGVYHLTTLDPSDRRVRVVGDVAVVSVRMDVAGTVAGEPVAAALRYTRVWAPSGGRWRVVAGHMSAVAGPA